jgi:hypothetical protein
MESAEGVAAKRRVLVDALMMCLERSKVCEVLDAPTIRSVLEMAARSGDLWREGEFRLEYIWKILCQQPGLTAKEVAPPLLVFKAYEEELAVQVRAPQALTALPRAEQVRLRDELGLSKSDFSTVIAKLQALAAAEQSKRAEDKALRDEVKRAEAEVTDAAGASEPSYTPPTKATPRNLKMIALALGGVALLTLPIALYLTFRQNVAPVDVSETAGFLRLSDARREAGSLTARIADPKWEGLPKEEREKVANQVFDAEMAKGIISMTLLDAQGRTRVIASYLGGNKMVIVR